MPKTKEIALDLRKRIAVAHRAGDGYTKLPKHFQSVKNWREKYHQEIQRQPQNTEQTWEGRKRKKGKTLEIKLPGDVSKNEQ